MTQFSRVSKSATHRRLPYEPYMSIVAYRASDDAAASRRRTLAQTQWALALLKFKSLARKHTKHITYITISRPSIYRHDDADDDDPHEAAEHIVLYFIATGAQRKYLHSECAPPESRLARRDVVVDGVARARNVHAQCGVVRDTTLYYKSMPFDVCVWVYVSS